MTNDFNPHYAIDNFYAENSFNAETRRRKDAEKKKKTIKINGGVRIGKAINLDKPKYPAAALAVREVIEVAPPTIRTAVIEELKRLANVIEKSSSDPAPPTKIQDAHLEVQKRIMEM